MNRAQILACLSIFLQILVLAAGLYTQVYSFASFGAAIGAIIYMSKDI